jgi:hypothetical protein
MKLIILALLTTMGFSLFENSYTIKHINKMEDFLNILESDFVSMVYFYSDNNENSLRAATLIE